MKKSITLLVHLSFLLVSFSCLAQSTITFPSKDGLVITADSYIISESAPTIILCHQAGYSRGEYIQTGRRFNKLGFNCLAIDQRSGDVIYGIKNETAALAKTKSSKPVVYLDAEQDIIAAVDYVFGKFNKKVILLGSSYSASLALKIGKESDKVSAVIAFSPGEYFGNKLFVQKVIADFNKPLFVTSTKAEAENVGTLIKDVKSTTKVQFIPQGEGAHGSKALWRATPGNQEYWMSLIVFSKGILELK
jgi:hypothetical protein